MKKKDIPLDLVAPQSSDKHWYGFYILLVYSELPCYSPCHQRPGKKVTSKPKAFTRFV